MSHAWSPHTDGGRGHAVSGSPASALQAIMGGSGAGGGSGWPHPLPVLDEDAAMNPSPELALVPPALDVDALPAPPLPGAPRDPCSPCDGSVQAQAAIAN